MRSESFIKLSSVHEVRSLSDFTARFSTRTFPFDADGFLAHTNPPPGLFLVFWRKPENPEEPHTSEKER